MRSLNSSLTKKHATMKLRFPHMLPLAVLMFIGSCSGNAQSKEAPKAEAATPTDRIEVLDFHTTHRCKTCLEIEAFTRQLLAESYAGEMEKGVITFRLINADDKANAAIVEKYLAFGTTLIINTVHNGQENHIDLTSFAFMNADDKAKFTTGMKEHIDAALKKIRS